MRSIIILSETLTSTAPLDVDIPAPTTPHRQVTTIDTDRNILYLTSTPTTLIKVVNPSTKPVVQDHNLPPFTSDLGGDINALQYLPDSDSLCMGYSDGDIVMLPCDKYDVDALDENAIVGTVEGGIRAMEWSPDLEIFALITGKGTVLVMTKDFELIAENPIQTDRFGEEEMHALGWGKKETQFHGSAGKAAAQAPSIAQDPKSIKASEDDDGVSRISWRGDGVLFAVSTVDVLENSEKRTVRIYNRECVLQSTSELVPQLEHVLSWRPSGNLVASSQRLPNRHDVVFFEKNGLRHGEFTLREPLTTKVVELSFNADSTILAIWLERVEESDRSKSVVQLWTMSNYYWYLNLEISVKDKKVSSMFWDPDSALKLYVSFENGLLRTFTLFTDVQVSSSLSEKSPKTVAVTDGCNLHLTPFRNSNVPPPMFATEIAKLPAPIHSVSFGPGSFGDDISLLLSDLSVHLYKSAGGIKPYTPIRSFKIALESFTFLRQLVWLGESLLFAIASHPDEAVSDYLVALKVLGETIAVEKVVVPGSEVGLVRLVSDTGNRKIVVENAAGDVYEVDTTTLRATHLVTLPEVCPWITATFLFGDELTVFGLSFRNRLYINARQLSTEANSFTIHPTFLIFSTLSHSVRFVNLNVPSEDNIVVPEPQPTGFDETSRRVERGSKIVLSVPFDTKLVLQMPRGNLESVHPRALVLSVVRAALEREENICVTLYPDHPPRADLEKIEDKTNRVCKAMEIALLEAGEKDYISSILTTDAKRQPPDLETAMTRIKKLRAASATDSEKALKYLIFIANVDNLYNVALGMYDFGLVLLVAQYSQKDPREYLPFLTELKELTQYRQRFRIDDYLERREKALGNLSLLLKEAEAKGGSGEDIFDEDFQRTGEEAQGESDLIPNNVFMQQVNELQLILNAYGESLKSKTKLDEAGLAFYMAGEKSKAVDAYTNAVMWTDALSIAQELEYSAGDLENLARKFAESLDEAHRYREAGAVLIEYAGDVLGGVRYLLRGSDWFEAWRMCLARKRLDLIDEIVKPGILDGFELFKEDLTSMRDTFTKQRSRLNEVRAEIARKKALAESGEYDPILDSIEMMSDTSSMATSRTGHTGSASRLSGTSSAKSGSTYTSNRSKARRKHERRRLAGKEGGVYEEEFLVNSMNAMVGRTNTLRADLKKLVKALLQFGYLDQGSEIQALFVAVVETIKNGMKGVFEGLPKVVNSLEEEKIKLMQEAGSMPKVTHVNAWPSKSVEMDPLKSESKWAIKFADPVQFEEASFGYGVLERYNKA
ncbi:hypothetical protein HDU97_006901 [Phlyctochytrium planicorne]|nr:hypothetical protein HDU97_006901 [Phlyctochytrium planicorne]